MVIFYVGQLPIKGFRVICYRSNDHCDAQQTFCTEAKIECYYHLHSFLLSASSYTAPYVNNQHSVKYHK